MSSFGETSVLSSSLKPFRKEVIRVMIDHCDNVACYEHISRSHRAFLVPRYYRRGEFSALGNPVQHIRSGKRLQDESGDDHEPSGASIRPQILMRKQKKIGC